MGLIRKTQTRSVDSPADEWNGSARRIWSTERCPQYNDGNGSSCGSSAEDELPRPRVALSSCSVLSYTLGDGVANPAESLLHPQTPAASGYPFEAQDYTQAAPKFRAKCLLAGPESNPSFVEEKKSGAISSTASNPCATSSQENFNRGRRKETFPSNPADADVVEFPERTSSSYTRSPQPATRQCRGRTAAIHDPSSSSGHEPKTRISVLSWLSATSPRPSPCQRSPSHTFTMHPIRRIGDLTSLFLAYVLTIAIISSQHPDNGWLVDLPLMELLPSSFTHPSQLVMLLQFTGWSLIGILHLFRSPRYWPECGLVAIVVSIAVGGWFGLQAMLDSLIITAFVSLLVAKAIEWVSKNRAPSVRGILPFAEQDGKY